MVRDEDKGTQSTQEKQEKERPEPQNGQSGNRRRLITGLAAGGAVTSALLATGKWTKPLVESVVLPAHAQTSAVARAFLGGGGVGSVASREANDWLSSFISSADAGATAAYSTAVACAQETGAGTNKFNIKVEFSLTGGGVEQYSADSVPADGAVYPLAQGPVCSLTAAANVRLTDLTANHVTVGLTVGTASFTVISSLAPCTLPSGSACPATPPPARNFTAQGSFPTDFTQGFTQNNSRHLLQLIISDVAAATIAAAFDTAILCASETGSGTGIFNILAEFHSAGFSPGIVEKYAATGVQANGNPNTMTQNICLLTQNATIQLSGLTATQVTMTIVAGSTLTLTGTLGICALPSGAICAL